MLSGLIGRLIKRGTKKAAGRGVGRRSDLFLALSVLAVVVRLARRLAGPHTDVTTEELRPGQKLVITHQSEPS